MKILFLNLYDDPEFSGGGAEVTLQNLAVGLQRRGVEPVVLATGPGTGLQQFERDGVRIWRAGLRNLYWPQSKVSQPPLKRMLWHLLDSYNVAMGALLGQVLATERPDVVSIHNLPGWSVAAWNTIARAGIPMVQVLHDAYLICPRSIMYTQHGNCSRQCVKCRLLRLPHRSLSRRLSAVVGVSRYILDRHLAEGYFRDVPIQRAIHNARDPAALGVADVDSSRPYNGPLRIGYIGRIAPSKGIDVLCREFTDAALANIELHIAGSGNDEYTRTLQQQWASDRIRFLGRVTPREFYPEMDVVVVPSLWQEPLGMVVAEALAFGKPVIGSRRGGIPEMIEDGENGLLFEPDHPGELAAALARLVRDDALRARMGVAARVSAQPFLDREAWVEQYLALYREISTES